MTGLYLAAIFLGAATLAILFILYLNREDPFTRSMTIGMVFCLIMMTTASLFFRAYMPVDESSSGMLIMTMLIDISFYIFVIFWIHATNILNRETNPIPTRAVPVVLMVCGVLYEAAGYLEAYMVGLISILLFDAVMVICGGYFVICGVMKKESGNSRWALMASGTGLAVYGAQLIYTDRISYVEMANGTKEAWAHSCMPVLVIAFEVAALAYFFYADPAGIKKKSKASAAEGSLQEKYELTVREEEIARLILQGLSNPQIAEETFISENTVKKHLTSIYKKTGTKSRYDLIVKLEGKD